MDSERVVQDGLAMLAVSLRQPVDAVQARAYVKGLSKVQADVITAAVDTLIAQLATQPVGKRYFPTVPDWLAACAEIVRQRRAVARQRALAMRAECAQCDGTGWATVQDDDDHERAKPCWCVVRGNELMAAAGQPIALPPARETNGDE